MKPVSMPTVSFSTFATGARRSWWCRNRWNDEVRWSACLVDAVDDGGVSVVGGRGDQRALGAGGRCAEALSWR